METLTLPLPGLDAPPVSAPEPEPDAAPALYVVVYGTPEPAGSKKAVPMGKGPGARWGVVDANPKSRKWKDLVAQHAGEAMGGRPLLRGPLRLALRFTVRRPKGHYGRKGLLPSAPPYPTTRPDVLKLARSVEDSLSGVAFLDDSQVVSEVLEKRYGPQEGVEIMVTEMTA